MPRRSLLHGIGSGLQDRRRLLRRDPLQLSRSGWAGVLPVGLGRVPGCRLERGGGVATARLAFAAADPLEPLETPDSGTGIIQPHSGPDASWALAVPGRLAITGQRARFTLLCPSAQS